MEGHLVIIDPGKIRAYENDRRRHLTRADALLDSMTEQVRRLKLAVHAAPRSPQAARTSWFAATDAKRLAADAVELVERLAALEALNEVSYLTTEEDSDA